VTGVVGLVVIVIFGGHARLGFLTQRWQVEQ
jgi:hypothetical protein